MSVPVPVSVRVVEPSLEGQVVEFGTLFGGASAGWSEFAEVLVSSVVPTVITATSESGNVLLAVATPAEHGGPSVRALPALDVDYLSTARALLLTHPLLLTADEGTSRTLASVIDGHPAVGGLAGIVHAHGGLGDGALLSEPVQAAQFGAALRVLEDLVEFVEATGLGASGVDTAGGGANGSRPVGFYVSPRRSYDLFLESARVRPELVSGWMSAPLGIGVDFRFRAFGVDASAYGSVYEVVDAVLAKSDGTPGASAVRLLPGSLTAQVDSNTKFKWSQAPYWLGQGTRMLFGVEPGSLPLADDGVYLVVGSTSGWGWGSAAQWEIEDRWASELPGVEHDLNRIHTANYVKLVLFAVKGFVEILDGGPAFVLDTFSCALPSISARDRRFSSQSLADALACAFAALTAGGIDVGDVEKDLVKNSISQVVLVVGDEVYGSAGASGGQVHALNGFTLTAGAVLKLIAKAYVLGVKAETMHRVIDSAIHTQLQVAVVEYGSPRYGAEEVPGRHFPPHAQLFVSPRAQVLAGTDVTLDASNSLGGSGGLIAAYEFDDGLGPIVETSLDSRTVTYSTAGEYWPRVRVRNSLGEWSDWAGERLEVVSPPPPRGPDLLIWDYSIGGVWLRDEDFTTYVIEHDEELELVVAWRNLGDVAVDGTRFDVGVFVNGDLHLSRHYDFAAVDGGDDRRFVLNTAGNRLPPGMHTVTMWVDYRDAIREKDETNNTRSFALRVEEPPNLRPTASFTFVTDGLTVRFTDTSTDPNGPDDIIGWLWSFGDGNVSNVRNPVHTYAAAGEYEVTLRVTDRGGLAHQVAHQVRVEADEVAPEADFDFEIDELTVTFTDRSMHPSGVEELVSWLWIFGDGEVSEEQHPVHTYAESGEYVVSLLVVDRAGLMGQRERVVRVEGDGSAVPRFSPSRLDFSGEAGEPAPPSQTLMLHNDGTASGAFGLSATSMVSYDPASVTIPAGDSHPITVSVEACPDGDEGTTTGSITATGNGNSDDADIVRTCGPPPEEPVGMIQVTINGLPSGVAADVYISGQGWDLWPPFSVLLPDMPTGSYTMSAGPVTTGGITYNPTPTNSTFTVTASTTTTVTINYAQ